MAFVTKQKKSLLFASVIFFNIFLGGQLIRKSIMQSSNNLYVYDVYGKSLLDIVQGKHLTTLTSPEMTGQSEHFITTNNRAYHGVNEQNYLLPDERTDYVSSKENFTTFDRYLIMFAGHDSIYQHTSTIPVDFAIIQNDYIPNIDKMRHYYDIRSIIVDGTNSYDVKKLVRKECYKYKIPFHDTQYSAFNLEF